MRCAKGNRVIGRSLRDIFITWCFAALALLLVLPLSAATPAMASAPWRFAVVGDTHVPDSTLVGEMVPAMVADGVELVLFPGDIVDSGRGVSADELRSQLTAWKAAVQPLVAAGIGVYPIRGNHEADAPDNVAAWNEAFTGPFALPADGPSGEVGLTYSFTHRNALFAGLDDYANLHRLNQAWLDARFASRGGLPHVFVFGHEPAFKVFHTDCLDDDATARNAFWASLKTAGARVYLCGHDHFFDAARISEGAASPSDLLQFVVGTGGGTLFDRHTYNGDNAPYVPSGLSHLEANGYLLVEVSGAGDGDLGVTLTFKQRVVGEGGAASYAAAYTTSYTAGTVAASGLTSPVPDTGQTACYGNSSEITCPQPGQPFYGQDSQCAGRAPSFTKSADGLTVLDGNTGLTWQQSPDTDGDGVLDSDDKLSWAEAQLRPAALNAASFGGYTDWRLPTLKELYSLIDFRGTDPNVQSTDTSGLIPFIDRAYFAFVYGDTAAGERVIDAQYWSSTGYVSTTMGGNTTEFGVNFADGRIKGYPRDTGPGGAPFKEFLRCVRGNPAYGANALTANGDGTVTDSATGLMWAQADSGAAMSWQDALAWVQARNAAGYLGHSDWRLPNAKELQSILDYTRSPDTTASAAIDPVLSCTPITNEGGSPDFPWYWAGTTHVSASSPGTAAVYVCFGRAVGWMKLQGASCYSLLDVHGAGAQRSDPKTGSLASYALGAACTGGTAYGRGPQGDVVRLQNFVRLVRDAGDVTSPLAAALTFSPSAPGDATPVTFTATASGGTPPYTYAWDLDGTQASGPSTTKTFPAGSHTVRLTVGDAAGGSATTTRTVSVASTLACFFTSSPAHPTDGAPVTFAASASGGTPPYTCAWDLDGTSASGITATRTFSAGSHLVTLTVSDSAGTSVTSAGTVTVARPVAVTGVVKASDPFRLKVSGSGFQLGCSVIVGGAAATTVVWKSDGLVVAKGDGLKSLVPKGVPVEVVVLNPDGGESAPFLYTR